MKQFAKCMWRYSPLFLIGILMSYFLAQVVVTGNEIIGKVIDDMLAGQNVEFKAFAFKMVLIALLGFVMAFVNSVCISRYSILVQTRYKRLVADKLYRLEYRYFDNNSSASVINKVNGDIAEADMFLNENLPFIISNLVKIVTYAVFIGRLNMRLLILMMVMYPFVLFISNYISQKIINLKKIHRQKSDAISEVSQDSMSGIIVLRSFLLENFFQKRLDCAADALVDNEEHRTRISNNAMLIRKILQWIPNIACAVYAYVLVRNGELTIGSLMAFVVILGHFVDAVVGLPFDMVEAREHLVCIRRVENILSQKEEQSGNVREVFDAQTAIEFENVNFGYDDRQVLNNLSFKIAKGSKVAFVGDSGGGKSTIFHLICGFYPVSSGSYRLCGTEFGDWDIECARDNISLVSQNVFLFPATIRENVAYGNRNAGEEDIIAACRSAGIHDFIMSLPDGYDTITGERGVLLSGGERQRISIARAILKDAPILLFDEPTSAVDVGTESLIEEAIDKLGRNKTTVTIAHRLSTIRNADVIMVLKYGHIVEAGTHSELMAAGGVYASMYGMELNGKAQECEVI